ACFLVHEECAVSDDEDIIIARCTHIFTNSDTGTLAFDGCFFDQAVTADTSSPYDRAGLDELELLFAGLDLDTFRSSLDDRCSDREFDSFRLQVRSGVIDQFRIEARQNHRRRFHADDADFFTRYIKLFAKLRYPVSEFSKELDTRESGSPDNDRQAGIIFFLFKRPSSELIIDVLADLACRINICDAQRILVEPFNSEGLPFETES